MEYKNKPFLLTRSNKSEKISIKWLILLLYLITLETLLLYFTIIETFGRTNSLILDISLILSLLAFSTWLFLLIKSIKSDYKVVMLNIKYLLSNDTTFIEIHSKKEPNLAKKLTETILNNLKKSKINHNILNNEITIFAELKNFENVLNWSYKPYTINSEENFSLLVHNLKKCDLLNETPSITLGDFLKT